MLGVRQELQPKYAPYETLQNPHRGEALCMLGVQKELQSYDKPYEAPQNPHGGETIQLLKSVERASAGG
ncbi:Hypothetical predicted protein [Podarcis lilfordi]|uniref:Uncharacterized protein n=1 Tax=Podarcis lilfordi TaxID=74358 RepID=A0AA35NYT7_9SAUR|nr:Hypothetical predicted protein [Podarcis lilfordi]